VLGCFDLGTGSSSGSGLPSVTRVEFRPSGNAYKSEKPRRPVSSHLDNRDGDGKHKRTEGLAGAATTTSA
jgi:hypothetical protein